MNNKWTTALRKTTVQSVNNSANKIRIYQCLYDIILTKLLVKGIRRNFFNEGANNFPLYIHIKCTFKLYF